MNIDEEELKEAFKPLIAALQKTGGDGFACVVNDWQIQGKKIDHRL